LIPWLPSDPKPERITAKAFGLENLFYDLMATDGSPDTDNHWSKEMCAFCFVALLDFF
jgi:hypothetical protein